jgi:hypothetical protein
MSTHVGWARPTGRWSALLGGVCPVGDGNSCCMPRDVVLCLLTANNPLCCDRTNGGSFARWRLAIGPLARLTVFAR